MSRLVAAINELMPKSQFLRNVSILTGGTVFAQGLAVLSLPLLTRLFTPEDFSLLAVYMAVLGLITVVSCLRLNIAIPIPECDGDAINLLALSIGSALIISSFLALVVFILPDLVVAILRQPGLRPYLWMIPVGVLFASIYAALQYWASRKKRFGLVTRTRVTRAMGGVGTQLSFGLINSAPFGLLLGHMVYSGTGVIQLLRAMWKQDRELLSRISKPAMRRNLIEQRRFPIYSVPEALFNTAGIQVPVIIIAAAVAGPEAGFLLLAMRVMGLPMGLIGSSVAQVYLAEAPKKFREGTLAPFTLKAIWNLTKVGAPVLLLIGVLSPSVFPIVFGEEWGRAGQIVAWMTPWFILQFISSPVSIVLHITKNQLVAMLLQLLGLALRLGFPLLALRETDNFMVEAYAVSGVIFYGIYLIVVIRVIGENV